MGAARAGGLALDVGAGALRRPGLVGAGLGGEPRKQLVSHEPKGPTLGKAVVGNPTLPDHLPERFRVDLEELGGLRGGEDRRIVGGVGHLIQNTGANPKKGGFLRSDTAQAAP